jgi:indole-3-acetate monooxygenase
VPKDLGGGGAELPDLCHMLRIIGRSCGSTALAFAMHTHQVAIPAWRWQHAPASRPAVEPLLRRVAEERLFLLSSGGADWVGGSGTARKVDGGYRVTARKSIISGAPTGDLLVTGAVVEEPDGPMVIHFAAPMTAPEVHLRDTWHTLGMRGTGSHDVDLDDLFIPDTKVALKRKAGEWHPLFQIIATIAFPLIYAAYLGVAESARDIAVDMAAKRAPSGRATRLAGQMDTALRAA